MVQVDGGNHAYLPILLSMELFRNGLEGLGAGNIHVDHAGVSFPTGSNGSGSRSGVRSEGAGIVSNRRTGSFKIHEAQLFGAVQHSAAAAFIVHAGQCLGIVLVSDGTQVVSSCLELGVAHTVADEQEHILGCILCIHLGRNAAGRNRFRSGFLCCLCGLTGLGRLCASNQADAKNSSK